MKLDISPMLNAYPDSMGGTLHDIVQLLARPEFENVFGSFYILPSVFNTDLDRGFSVIDYTLNRELAGPQDMEGLKALGLKLKLDFILNHASVLSPQFQDLLKNGKNSVYRDFFINWNDFWQGCGSMTEQGYIQPEAKYLEKMFFRKPGLPILMARMPDGTEEPYWNAIENKDGSYLAAWADELRDHQIHTVNMLGCHDGIPLLDLKGLLPEERIQSLIGTIVARGGMVKDLHGQKNIYYQVNATYYSALGADDDKMLLARAIQLFMPGKPQVWYLDLFAGKNDVEAVRHAGAGGHKEINRTNLNAEQINTALQRDVVQRQLDLLRLRKTHPAFHSDAEITTTWSAPVLSICWKHGADMIALRADLVKDKFEIQ